jgi:anti-sigma-K factor RskA
MSHTDYQDLLAACALDALDPADGQALGEHLATCEDCREELNALREAGGLLAHASPMVEPGAHVRAQILAKVRAEAVDSRPAKVVQMPQRAKTVWPNVLRLAAAIALVGVLASAVLLWRREVRLQVEMARQQEALALLNSGETTKIQLNGMPAAPNARATFAFDKRTERAVLMVDGLPMTPADKAYEVWFIPKGRSPMPGKVFTVDSSGHAMIMERMPSEAMDGAVIAVTVEPKNGSAAPTGAIHLASPAL